LSVGGQRAYNPTNSKVNLIGLNGEHAECVPPRAPLMPLARCAVQIAPWSLALHLTTGLL
jgi:hypothetical protein